MRMTMSASKRTVFFVSDGTGITAEALGRSLLAQFNDIEFDQITLPYIDDKAKAFQVVQKINNCMIQEGHKPIIFDTIVNQEIRQILASSKGFMIDIFSTFLNPLELELKTKSSYTVGKSHSIVGDTQYATRISAINYALDNDDGIKTHHYDTADVVIVGVSRCGKTPTCLYLALQFGIRAANYPFTEDDLDDLKLPNSLKPYKNKLFGLSIEPERLAAIRNERKPNSRYASFRQCESEIRGVEALFAKENIPYLNSTHYSIEEISTKLMAECDLNRFGH